MELFLASKDGACVLQQSNTSSYSKYVGIFGLNSANLGVLINLKVIFKPNASISKGQGYQGFLWKRAKGAALAKKGQFASYKEKLEKRTECHSF
jgi:hypothetical protein